MLQRVIWPASKLFRFNRPISTISDHVAKLLHGQRNALFAAVFRFAHRRKKAHSRVQWTAMILPSAEFGVGICQTKTGALY
tara:strand:+ start:399 stop:641 length:243 start_codon:yes stop_codon:yes gene_type:complete